MTSAEAIRRKVAQADFSWVITGARSGYYFRINVIDLSDLKLEKSESGIQDALFGTLANP